MPQVGTGDDGLKLMGLTFSQIVHIYVEKREGDDLFDSFFFFRRIESTPPQSDSAACLRQPLKHARTLFALAMGSVLPAAQKPEASMMTTETSKKVVYIISAKVRLYFRNLEQRFVKHYSPMDVLFNFRFLTVDSHLLLRFATGFILLEFLLPSKNCWHCSGESPTWRIIPGLVSGY